MPNLEKQIKTAEKKLEVAREKLKKLFPGNSDSGIDHLMKYKDERENTKKAGTYQTVRDLESKIRFLKQKGGTRRRRRGKGTRKNEY
jgi:hypothetical protein